MCEKKIKHLEFTQNVITRNNQNSFLLKGWCVTLVAALFALAVKDTDLSYFLITYFSIPIFWLLDAYYLSIERQYIQLYNNIRDLNEDKINFDMNAKTHNSGSATWIMSFLSKTLIIFYLSQIIIILTMIFLIK